MNYELVTQTIDLGDGRPVTIETGKLAKQANGSVVVRQGDTMLLAAVVASTQAKDGVDFLPLTVEYREKYAAAGRFPGGYFKREARPYDDCSYQWPIGYQSNLGTTGNRGFGIDGGRKPRQHRNGGRGDEGSF